MSWRNIKALTDSIRNGLGSMPPRRDTRRAIVQARSAMSMLTPRTVPRVAEELRVLEEGNHGDGLMLGGLRYSALAQMLTQPKLPDSESIGLEVEVEFADRNTRDVFSRAIDARVSAWVSEFYLTRYSAPAWHWSMESDGSLRNGAELVTRPNHERGDYLTVQELSTAIDLIAPAIASYCEDSWRAGLQMHVCVDMYTLLNLRNFLITYLAVEPYVFGALGHGRWQSNFCVPLSQSPDLVRRLFAVNTAREMREYLTEWPKYTAVNLRPILEHGTIEFRHAQTPTDERELSGVLYLYESLSRGLRNDAAPSAAQDWYLGCHEVVPELKVQSDALLASII